jgi:cysteine desulfurase
MTESLLAQIPGVIINGSREQRVANNVNISIPGIDSEFAVITLDAHGIATSTKSACGTSDSQGSYVVRVIADEARALSAIRFTLGESNTKNDIRHAVEVLTEHVSKTRTFSDSLIKSKV